MKNTLIVVLGPTASGKTEIAIRLAKVFGSEIISADSRQFFREIPIGTAAPNTKQLSEIEHHFVGHLNISDSYNVSTFEHDVMELLKKKFISHKMMVMTGGSGLYLDAVTRGIDLLPDPDESIRSELNEFYTEYGLEALKQELLELDPEYYKIVDLNNPKRLIRAIEVCRQTGKTFTELRTNSPQERSFGILKIGLEVPRDELINRIHLRVDSMIEDGLVEEARNVYQYKHLNALNTVGYKELFRYFDGVYQLQEAIEKIKTNTRRFAKRQMTWFRKDKEINWFTPAQYEEIVDFIKKEI